MNQTDIWKPIAGFPGYFVSDLGKVMSTRQGAPLLLKMRIGYRGHYRVMLRGKDGAPVQKYVHRLVLVAFVGAPRGERRFVDHINRNKKDNRVSNLRWATASENRHNVPQRNIELLSSGNWRARIFVRGKLIPLGTFPVKELAARAYDAAKAKHLGVFACEL